MPVNSDRRLLIIIVIGNLFILGLGFFLWWQANEAQYRQGDGQWLHRNMWVPVMLWFSGISLIVFLFLANATGAIASSSRPVRLVCGVTAGVTVMLAVVAWTWSRPGAEVFMDGFVRWADREVDIESIARWVDATESDQPIEAIEPNTWPTIIADHHPTDVILLNHGEAVEIHWGGGFRRFGLTIVADDATESACAAAGRASPRYVVPLKSQACAWHH